MPKGSLNMSLKGADDIFSTEESRQEQQREHCLLYTSPSPRDS